MTLRRRPGIGIEHRDEVGLIHSRQSNGALLSNRRFHEASKGLCLRDDFAKGEHTSWVIETCAAAAVEPAEGAIWVRKVVQKTN